MTREINIARLDLISFGALKKLLKIQGYLWIASGRLKLTPKFNRSHARKSVNWQASAIPIVPEFGKTLSLLENNLVTC